MNTHLAIPHGQGLHSLCSELHTVFLRQQAMWDLQRSYLCSRANLSDADEVTWTHICWPFSLALLVLYLILLLHIIQVFFFVILHPLFTFNLVFIEKSLMFILLCKVKSQLCDHSKNSKYKGLLTNTQPEWWDIVQEGERAGRYTRAKGLRGVLRNPRRNGVQRD